MADNDRGRPGERAPHRSNGDTLRIPPAGDDATASASIDLATVVPSGGRPKGLVAYHPSSKSRVTVERILALYDRMEAADALPLGPRAAGYRLKETFVGDYTKAEFPAIETVIKRLQQAGRIPWTWVSDASSATYEADGWGCPADFLRDAVGFYERDLRDRQPVVVEVYCEAKETLPLIARVSAERGVTVYSGSGSSGPNLAYKVATRAVIRAVAHGQSTMLLGVCDFDQAGIRNVLRPHLEHVAAFCYATSAANDRVLTWDGKSIRDAGASVSFRQLALTPQMSLDLVETEHDRDRIVAYLDSGADAWTRHLDLLDGVQKVETEALDPVALRDLVAAAIDDVLDGEILSALAADQVRERADLKRRIGVIADDLEGGAR